MLIGRSPVRISFGGGGTDLPSYYEQFGAAPFSALPFDKYFYTILGNRSDGRIQVISSDLRLFGNWSDLTACPLCPIKAVAWRFLSRCSRISALTLPPTSSWLSEIPPGTGLGSSPAVCVNLLKVAYHPFALSIVKVRSRGSGPSTSRALA